MALLTTGIESEYLRYSPQPLCCQHPMLAIRRTLNGYPLCLIHRLHAPSSSPPQGTPSGSQRAFPQLARPAQTPRKPLL